MLTFRDLDDIQLEFLWRSPTPWPSHRPACGGRPPGFEITSVSRSVVHSADVQIEALQVPV